MWCRRNNIPTVPSASPVNSHISHRGRDRSSGGSFSSAHTFSRADSSPGAGIASVWRTSKPESSTHRGGPKPTRGRNSAWRRRGARARRCSRRPRNASSRSSREASRRGVPSRMANAATCMGRPWSSTRRLLTSIGLSRSRRPGRAEPWPRRTTVRSWSGAGGPRRRAVWVCPFSVGTVVPAPMACRASAARTGPGRSSPHSATRGPGAPPGSGRSD